MGGFLSVRVHSSMVIVAGGVRDHRVQRVPDSPTPSPSFFSAGSCGSGCAEYTSRYLYNALHESSDLQPCPQGPPATWQGHTSAADEATGPHRTQQGKPPPKRLGRLRLRAAIAKRVAETNTRRRANIYLAAAARQRARRRLHAIAARAGPLRPCRARDPCPIQAGERPPAKWRVGTDMVQLPGVRGAHAARWPSSSVTKRGSLCSTKEEIWVTATAHPGARLACSAAAKSRWPDAIAAWCVAVGCGPEGCISGGVRHRRSRPG
jgi:hypothetical protein